MTTPTVSRLALCGALAMASCSRGETEPEPAAAPAPPPAVRAPLDPEVKYRDRVAELERDREDLLAALLVATGPGVRCGRATAGGAELIAFLPAGARGLVIGHGLAAEPAGARYVAWTRAGDAAWQPVGDLRTGLGLPGHRLVFLREPGEPDPQEIAVSIETAARPAAMAAPVATIALGRGC
jgi:hypothetical protein